jgi:hypothetical protein
VSLVTLFDSPIVWAPVPTVGTRVDDVVSWNAQTLLPVKPKGETVMAY